MFHFNFAVDDAVDDLTIGDSSAVLADKAIYGTISASQETFSEIDFESLVCGPPLRLSLTISGQV